MKKLNSDWIVGFVDGDGHFGFSTGPKKVFYFVVSQDKRSIDVLFLLKSFFNCGSVHKAGNNMREYKVSSKQQLEKIIIPFFLKHPLKTSKIHQFEYFVQKVNPFLLAKQPLENTFLTLDWLVGFIDAEGCFVCSIIDKTIRPQFILGLHAKDKNIITKIQSLLNIGLCYTRKNGVEIFQVSSNKTMCQFARQVLLTSRFKDRLKTLKRIRARKWCKIVLLMEQKKHKTIEGFKKIEKIYSTF